MPTKGKFSQRLRDMTEKLNYRQLLFLAFLASCLLGIFVYVSLSRVGVGEKPEQQVVTQHVNTRKVVVASRDIPQRAIVKSDMLKVIDVPEEMIPYGAVDDVKMFINHPASVFIQKGDVLTDQKVYVDPKMAGFPGIIPPDCRAFSIGISDVTGVAGFARPGDYVDIMLIKNKSSNGRLSGEIILQNVMLLGINKSANPPKTAAPVDEKAQGDDKSGGDKSGDKKKDKKGEQNNGNIQASAESMATATFALTPEEALQLAVAMQEGSIYLTLRPLHPKDMFVLKTDYSILSNDIPAPAAPQQQAPAPNVKANEAVAAPEPMPVYSNSIEVIRGVNSSVVGVND